MFASIAVIASASLYTNRAVAKLTIAVTSQRSCTLRGTRPGMGGVGLQYG